MARTEVFIENEFGEAQAWKTDLKGHGQVVEGEEFTIRELHQFGKGGLVKYGIRRRVRVISVQRRSQSFHVLKVKDLESSTK